MGIVQQAISALIAPSVAAAVSAALTPLRERVSMLEDVPGLTAEDRVTLNKAAQMVAEFEALAEGTIETPTSESTDTGGSITVTDVQP